VWELIIIPFSGKHTFAYTTAPYLTAHQTSEECDNVWTRNKGLAKEKGIFSLIKVDIKEYFGCEGVQE